jgi:hypothetical protein
MARVMAGRGIAEMAAQVLFPDVLGLSYAVGFC